MPNENVEVFIKGAAKVLGEGPHWEERSGKLLYVDILANAAYKYHVETGTKEEVTLDDNVGFIIPTSEEDCYVVSSLRKLCYLNWSTNTCTSIVEVPNVGERDRFNDGKCDASGRLWAGTMGLTKGTIPFQMEMNKASLFCLDKDNLTTAFSPVSLSNGLAWTADNSIMYYIDSMTRQVAAFDFDLQKGLISNRRVAVDLNTWSIEDAGYPDGMTIDQNGKLWVASFAGGKVMNFDPETGARLRDVTIPAKRVTSCCFGGKDYSELYVTTAVRRDAAEDNPLAGSIFRVTNLGVKGTPGYSYQKP